MRLLVRCRADTSWYRTSSKESIYTRWTVTSGTGNQLRRESTKCICGRGEKTWEGDRAITAETRRSATADGPRDALSDEILSTAAQLYEQAVQRVHAVQLQRYGRRTCSKLCRRTARRAVWRNTLDCCTTVWTSCTTNPRSAVAALRSTDV